MKRKTSIIKIFPLMLMLLIGTQGFTQKKSGTPVVFPKQHNTLIPKTPNDTLNPGNYNDTMDGVLIPDINGGYVLGTNSWNDKCKCEQFKVSYSYHIEGAIYWFGYKRADSAGLLRYVIWNMDSINGTTHDTTNQLCPGTLIVAVTDSTKNIDTSSNLSQAHIVMFPFPVLVTSDYCIGFDMSNIGEDSIALVSTDKGMGGNLEMVWEQWKSNNRWYTLQGAQWDSGTMDIDAMIFPIIDNTVGCVENGEFISGVKLSQSYPNPNPGECTISYELSNQQSSISIRILDIQGKQLFYTEDLDKSQGIHNAIIDVSHLPNGTYFYILSTNDAHLAKKMLISK